MRQRCQNIPVCARGLRLAYFALGRSGGTGGGRRGNKEVGVEATLNNAHNYTTTVQVSKGVGAVRLFSSRCDANLRDER